MDEWHIEKWFVVCKSERTLCLSTIKKTEKKENTFGFWQCILKPALRTEEREKKNQFKRLWFFILSVFVELSNYWAKKKCLEHFKIERKIFFFSWKFQVFKTKMIFFPSSSFSSFYKRNLRCWYLIYLYDWWRLIYGCYVIQIFRSFGFFLCRPFAIIPLMFI